MKPASILLIVCLSGCASYEPYYYPYGSAPGDATSSYDYYGPYGPGMPGYPGNGEVYGPPAYYDYGPPAYSWPYWPPPPDYFGFGLGYFSDGGGHPHDHDWHRTHPPPPITNGGPLVPRHGSNQLGRGFGAGTGLTPQPGIATTPTNPGALGLPSARHGSGQLGHGFGTRGFGATPSPGTRAAPAPAAPALPSANRGSGQFGRGVGGGVGGGVGAGGGGFTAGTPDQR